MRKYRQIYWLLLGLVIIVSCTKKPFDYRNKFLGDWEFKVDRKEFNTDSIGYHYHDSLTFLGQIKYGSGDNDLLIEYSGDNSITLKIDKEDELSDFPTLYCNGQFDENDKIHLYLRWGGLGGGITHVVDGEKK
ncbi:MAG: hypothetical protein ACWA41_06040 [Putridiphycobacter sp.]